MPDDDLIPDGREKFATTRWSVVLAAGGKSSGESAEALASLCQAYWYPLYAFIRRTGYRPEEAQDLTQEFFARVLEKGYLRAANPERGRFRSFLLAAFKHFLSNERARARAQKRGGHRLLLPLNWEAGESRYNTEPAHQVTAERLFEYHWALTLLDQVLAQLRDEFMRKGKGNLFERLKAYLSADQTTTDYRAVADALDTSAGAIKVAVHRFRRRFAALLRAEIAQTVATPDEVEDELKNLHAAIRLERP